MVKPNANPSREKRAFASNSLRQSRVASLVRCMTTRSVCLTTVVALCCCSLLASVSQFSRQVKTGGDISKPVGAPKTVRYMPRDPMVARVMSVARNERDDALFDLNMSNLKNQSLLTLKSHQSLGIKRRDVTTNTQRKPGKEAKFSESKSENKSNNNSSSRTSERVKAAKTQVTAKTVQRQPGKSAVTSNGTGNASKYISTGNTAQAQNKPAYLDTEIKERGEEDEEYSDVMGVNDVDYSLSNDPVRLSFVKNVSRYLTYLKRQRHLVEYYNQPITLLPQQSKGVVIVTNYRSGSTFLGELFNQHPDAFYTFEPLFPFTGGCKIQGQLMAQIVHRILRCDFQEMTDVYRQVQGKLRKISMDIECLLNNFCFRKNTRELCDKQFCPPGKYYSCRKCGPVHLPRAMNACRSKKLSVVKVIRLCDIANLKPAILDPKLDLKIIHLARDPRGIQSSRSKIHKNWSVKSNAELTCNRLLHNGQLGSANSTETSWLKGRYLRIRYEDLSLEPIKMAEKIYKFVGLDFRPSVKSWIYKNTHSLSPKTSNKVNPYTTKRDSAAAMQAWRKHLTFDQVSTVQSVCSEMMTHFGYTPVSNRKALENFNVTLLT